MCDSANQVALAEMLLSVSKRTALVHKHTQCKKKKEKKKTASKRREKTTFSTLLQLKEEKKNNPRFSRGEFYPEYAGYVLFGGVNNVGIAHGADAEFLVPHVEHLRDVDGRQSVAIGRYVVEEELEVAHYDELPHPAFLHTPHFWNFDVAFVGGADAACWVDSQRSFG